MIRLLVLLTVITAFCVNMHAIAKKEPVPKKEPATERRKSMSTKPSGREN